MELLEIVEHINGGALMGVAIILLTLVQISPIKINPWDSFSEWLGKCLTAEVRDDIKTLGERVDALQDDFSSFRVDEMRQTILTFARECRAGTEHSHEEWAHVLNVSARYEAYCASHNISNGEVTADSTYIHNLYQNLSETHKF